MITDNVKEMMVASARNKNYKKANSTALKPPIRLLPIHGVSDVEIETDR